MGTITHLGSNLHLLTLANKSQCLLAFLFEPTNMTTLNLTLPLRSGKTLLIENNTNLKLPKLCQHYLTLPKHLKLTLLTSEEVKIKGSNVIALNFSSIEALHDGEIDLQDGVIVIANYVKFTRLLASKSKSICPTKVLSEPVIAVNNTNETKVLVTSLGFDSFISN